MKVHVKLDTGMGRLGFLCDEKHFDETVRQITELLKFDGLDAEGIFTHFAVADEDDPASRSFTTEQRRRFLRVIEAVEAQSGHHFRLRHCCNAGGIANHPDWADDMVRCGVILYGAGELAERMGMRPAMTLMTTVSTVKTYASGTSISYGRQFFTARESRIAVLPIGYADGLHRALSGRLTVRTPYGLAQQVGRICMDMCMVDVTDQPEIKSGDEVEIFGRHCLVGAAAERCGTIPYELLCAVSKRVPRVYTSALRA